MKRRLISACTICALISSILLTSCLSSEQKQIANEKESISKAIAEEYLKENYGSGFIKNLSCITYTPENSALKSPKASKYVRATASVDNKDFFILVDTDSSKCLDNYNSDKIHSDIQRLAEDIMPEAEVAGIEVDINSKSVSELNEVDYEGYFNYSDKTMKEILQNGGYSIDVTLKYIDSDADFSLINDEPFFEDSSFKNDISLKFLNYRDKERFNISSSDYDISYSVKDIFTSVRKAGSQSISDSYHKFDSVSFDDFEIIWEPEKLELSFIDAEQEEDVMSEDYADYVFTAKNESGVKIYYSKLDPTIESMKIDFYFSNKNAGSYAAISDPLNVYNKHTIWEINKSSDPTYKVFEFNHDSGMLYAGIYNGEKNNKLSNLVNGFNGKK